MKQAKISFNENINPSWIKMAKLQKNNDGKKQVNVEVN